jgi:hypothetical protein
MTLEHVYPKWLVALLDERLSPTEIEVLRDGQTRRAPSLNATVKQVCKTCNNEWMSALEEDVRPFLTPMILGEAPVSLTPDNQHALACWTMKTALMVELFYPLKDRRLPVNLYSSFFRGRAPPNLCAIWSAAYRGELLALRAFSTRLTLTQPATYSRDGILERRGGELRGVLQTFCLFKAVFQLVVYEAGGFPLHLVSNPLGSIRIWPGRRPSTSWPYNMEAFDETEFMSLATRTVGGLSLAPTVST